MRDVAVSVVIPALNEAQCLPQVLARIPPDVDEVILVDGLSTDATVDLARRALPAIRVVTQQGRGKGAALRAGFEAAIGDIIIQLDADGSTDPAEIPAFVGSLLAGADYAKGTRFIQGAGTSDMTSLHRLGNLFFVRLANALFGCRFSDITYGYNAFWREHHHLLAPEIDDWAHEIIGNIRAVRYNLRVVEVASHEYPRIAGLPKLRTWSAGWMILRAIIAERFRRLPVNEPEPQRQTTASFAGDGTQVGPATDVVAAAATPRRGRGRSDRLRPAVVPTRFERELSALQWPADAPSPSSAPAGAARKRLRQPALASSVSSRLTSARSPQLSQSR